MISYNKCLGVDIGHNAIKIAELQRDKTGVKINKIITKEIRLTPGMQKEERAQIVCDAIKEIIKSGKLTTRRAVFSISGQNVFLRKILLPPVPDERMVKIVNYEARQQIPFPLDQTIIQYQVFREEGEEMVDVLLTAVKRDIINDFMFMIKKSGLKPVKIDVSSLALFNYFYYESQKADFAGGKKKKPFFSIGKKKVEEEPTVKEEVETEVEEGEIVAFINLGASTSDIAIGRLGKKGFVGFLRTAPTGGNDLTRLIQNRLDVSLEEAEKIKQKNTEILFESREAEELPSVNMEASKAATEALDRLIKELRLSIDYYISQPDGFSVDSVVLTGGQSNIPKIADFIEDRLGLPTIIKKNIETDKLELLSEPGTNISSYIQAIGLALHGIGRAKVCVDFLPEEQKTVEKIKSKKIEIGVIAALLCGILYFSSQFGQADIKFYNRELDNMQTEILSRQKIINKYEEAKKQHDLLTKRFNNLGRMFEDRSYCLRILQLINEIKPDDVWFQLIDIKYDGAMTIVGYAKILASLSNIVNSIENQKDYFEKVTLAGQKTIVDEVSRQQVYAFQINLKCKGKLSWPKIHIKETLYAERPAVIFRIETQPGTPETPGMPGRPMPERPRSRLMEAF